MGTSKHFRTLDLALEGSFKGKDEGGGMRDVRLMGSNGR
jgi:hypothetical protein